MKKKKDGNGKRASRNAMENGEIKRRRLRIQINSNKNSRKERNK